MIRPTVLRNLRVPVIVSPMFLISGPHMVAAACRAGAVGTFPALNQRTSEGFEVWLDEIENGLSEESAPYGVNLIVHHTNARLDADLDICVRRCVPLVITSLGARPDVVRRIQAYGGRVFHDVTNMRHARKAIEAGVDGLILVAAGAGGHAGTLSPFALIREVRQVFDGVIVLAGAISDGRDVAAAQVLGADLVYMGTRFMASRESLASEDLKRMLFEANAADILYTSGVSGIPGNFLVPSIVAAGLDPTAIADGTGYKARAREAEGGKAWKDIWSAGQGVASVQAEETVGGILGRIRAEHEETLRQVPELLTAFHQAADRRAFVGD